MYNSDMQQMPVYSTGIIGENVLQPFDQWSASDLYNSLSQSIPIEIASGTVRNKHILSFF